eukprot:9183902-Pyramimonas_sp.AAC.1
MDRNVGLIEDMVRDSRNIVRKFATAELYSVEFAKLMRSIGQNEGLCFAMRLAALDSDGDGHLSEDELKMFHEIG